MTEKAPERIWAQDAAPTECNYIGDGWWDDDCGSVQYPHIVEYTRTDLYDAVVAERDELRAEVEMMKAVMPTELRQALLLRKAVALESGGRWHLSIQDCERILSALTIRTEADVREECVRVASDWFDTFLQSANPGTFGDLADAIRKGTDQ